MEVKKHLNIWTEGKKRYICINEQKTYDMNKDFLLSVAMLTFTIAMICNTSGHATRQADINEEAAKQENLTKPAEMPYKVSEKGLNHIKKLEGLSLKKYNDAKGHSIGYGHYLQPGESYEVITQTVADSLFDADIRFTEKIINRLLADGIDTKGYRFSQNFVDGFADLIYNCGCGAVARSEFYDGLKNRVRYYDEEKATLDIKFLASKIKTFRVSAEGHKERRYQCHVMLAN